MITGFSQSKFPHCTINICHTRMTQDIKLLRWERGSYQCSDRIWRCYVCGNGVEGPATVVRCLLLLSPLELPAPQCTGYSGWPKGGQAVAGEVFQGLLGEELVVALVLNRRGERNKWCKVEEWSEQWVFFFLFLWRPLPNTPDLQYLTLEIINLVVILPSLWSISIILFCVDVFPLELLIICNTFWCFVRRELCLYVW